VGSTVAEVLRRATTQLQQICDSPRLDAEILLAQTLKWNRTTLYTRSDEPLSDNTIKQYQALIGQRQNGQPIAYLTGTQEFWSLTLHVNESVLIPRADTELLVETALHLVNAEPSHVLDLGTGSGAIALALASERPSWHLTATDLSTRALNIAKQNARRLKLKNIQFTQSNWFAALADARYSMIISNPPYVREHDHHLTAPGVRFEPQLALISGTDGLTDLRHIISNAATFLEDDGVLLLEHGFDQGSKVCKLLHEHGYTQIKTLQDNGGNPRVTYGYLEPDA